ncbi:unnamed protein product [Nippostrongylus brasiliensis]|uniref:FZ domain-containing protein n=1 Tax=Nippostrongylus brasiliensis TaxID=27835 RepID=A0A0N4XTV4_NIPBR|nr:unnamed protein product [Nippostrongylus brasiliensis]
MFPIAAIFVFMRTGCAFLFNSATDIAHCYELDLENCFREAFLAAIHPPIRGRRASPFFQTPNITVLDKRKVETSNLMLCHDVRRFSLCFHYPGCSEQVAAAMCEQTCSRDAMLICRRAMTSDEQQQEQSYIMEASTIAQSYNFGNEDTCDNFRQLLGKLVRFRGEFCGDLSRCTCSETRWEAATIRCGFDCDRIWRDGLIADDGAANFRLLSALLSLIVIQLM